MLFLTKENVFETKMSTRKNTKLSLEKSFARKPFSLFSTEKKFLIPKHYSQLKNILENKKTEN